MAVRISEGVGDVDLEGLSSGCVAEDAGVRTSLRRSVGSFYLGVMEGSLLEVEGTGRIEGEAVGGVVGVGGIETADDSDSDVGLVVAVGVFEEDKVGSHGDEDASSPELETGWVVQTAGEGFDAVRFAVAVLIFNDEEAIVHFLLGLQWG